jgi:hypothetical protein
VTLAAGFTLSVYLLPQIWEYNDVNDSGLMDYKNTNSSYIRVLDMENFNWTVSNFTNDTVENVDLMAESSSFTPTNSTAVISGSVRLVVCCFILVRVNV